jgi:hypothetical protein
VQWRPPRYHTVHRLLTNPVYAGAYVFGRTGSRVRFDDGHKVVTHGIARRREEWEVLIRDHHDGYISWEAYSQPEDYRRQRQYEGNDGGRLSAQNCRRAILGETPPNLIGPDERML